MKRESGDMKVQNARKCTRARRSLHAIRTSLTISEPRGCSRTVVPTTSFTVEGASKLLNSSGERSSTKPAEIDQSRPAIPEIDARSPSSSSTKGICRKSSRKVVSGDGAWRPKRSEMMGRRVRVSRTRTVCAAAQSSSGEAVEARE